MSDNHHYHPSAHEGFIRPDDKMDLITFEILQPHLLPVPPSVSFLSSFWSKYLLPAYLPLQTYFDPLLPAKLKFCYENCHFLRSKNCNCTSEKVLKTHIPVSSFVKISVRLVVYSWSTSLFPLLFVFGQYRSCHLPQLLLYFPCTPQILPYSSVFTTQDIRPEYQHFPRNTTSLPTTFDRFGRTHHLRITIHELRLTKLRYVDSYDFASAIYDSYYLWPIRSNSPLDSSIVPATSSFSIPTTVDQFGRTLLLFR